MEAAEPLLSQHRAEIKESKHKSIGIVLKKSFFTDVASGRERTLSPSGLVSPSTPMSSAQFWDEDDSDSDSGSEAKHGQPNPTNRSYGEIKAPHHSSSQVLDYQDDLFFPVDWTITWARWESVEKQVTGDLQGAGDIANYTHTHLWLAGAISAIWAALIGYTARDTYQRHESTKWGRNPQHFMESLLEGITPENYTNKCDLLNSQLAELIQNSAALRSKYEYMRFGVPTKGPQKGNLCFIYKLIPPPTPDSKAEPKQEPTAKKSKWPSRLLKFGSWLKVVLTWPGLWFWLVWMNIVFYTGSFSAINDMPTWAIALIFVGILVPSLVYTAFKVGNWVKHTYWPKKHITEAEQADLTRVFRTLLLRKQFEKANEALLGPMGPKGVAPAEYKLDFDSDPSLAQKRPGDELTPTERVEELVRYQQMKLWLTTVVAGAGAFSLQQYTMNALASYLASQGDGFSPEAIDGIGTAMVVIALLYAVAIYYEKSASLAKTQQLVTESKESPILAETEDRYKRLRAYKRKEAELLAKFEARRKEVLPVDFERTITYAKLLKPQTRDTPLSLDIPPVPDFYDPVSFEDPRRAGPSKHRKLKKVVKRFLIFTAAIQSAITMLRFWTVKGTAMALPFTESIDFVGLNQNWTAPEAFLLTAAIVGTLWGGLRLWEYVTQRDDARTELFLQQLPERLEILKLQEQHHYYRVAHLEQQWQQLVGPATVPERKGLGAAPDTPAEGAAHDTPAEGAAHRHQQRAAPPRQPYRNYGGFGAPDSLDAAHKVAAAAQLDATEEQGCWPW